jgi:glycosyltransferase involved in cell wall biosynthesis
MNSVVENRAAVSNVRAANLCPISVSVVVPTLNRSADLEALLGSIVRQTCLPDEVIVVDQSSDNLSKIVVSDFKMRHAALPVAFRHVVQEEKSLVKARNRGLGLAGGDIVSFLDDDAVLFDDYFEVLTARFRAEPGVGAISGNTIVKEKPSGIKWALRRAIMRTFLISGFDGRMTASGFGYPIYEREIERTQAVEFLPGCNMNFRKECLSGERFDEWFTGYSFREDCDFSYRIAQKTKAIMIPEARLYHNYSTSNRLDTDVLKRMEIRNYRHIFRKYKRKSFLSEALFMYSLGGLMIIDFIEALTTRRPEKLKKFKASIGSMMSLVFRGRLS